MKRVLVGSLMYLAALGCGGASADTGADAAPATDQAVTLFDGAHVYFGSENRRTVDVELELPAADLWFDRATLSFALRCPNDRCDWWDRLGWIALVRNPGEDQEEQIEIARFITPYRVGDSWSLEITELLPILRGDVTVRVFIDTWVGPGHANGDGWLVDASIDFRGGVASPEPFAVIPAMPPQSIVYGDPTRSPSREADLAMPEGASAVRLRTLITGHGQGSADNCAEFCSREHTFTVADEAFPAVVWRDDCQQTAAPNQQGTWTYPRAGWCPGALVTPSLHTLGAVPASTVKVVYDVESYENTCRPDATVCTNCVAGSCDYDGGGHTEPKYQVSALLVLYR